MPRPILPPRGAYIATRVIFHPTLPASLKETLIMLIALAWSSPSNITPPLSYPQLAKLTGKSVRRLFSHIAVLRDEYAALRLQSTGNGIFVVTLADWLFPPPRPGLDAYENWQLPVKEEEVLTRSIQPDENLLLNDHDHGSQKSSKPPAICPKRKPAARPAGSTGPVRALSLDLLDALAAAGVFPSLFAEVAVSPYAEDGLRALLAWAQDDQPGDAARLFIGRLRQGARPPAAYLTPPCPACGRRGDHAPDCRKRFTSGEFAEFMEH
jgi:hypothetical protein